MNLLKNTETLRIFFLLLRKCWQVRRRHWITSLIEIVIPVCSILLLYRFDGTLRDKLDVINETHYKSRSFKQLIDQMDGKSIMIMYAPTNPFTDKLIIKVDECLEKKVDFRGFDTKTELVIHASNESSYVVPVIFEKSTDASTKHLHYVLLGRHNLNKYNNMVSYVVGDHYADSGFVQIQICLDRMFVELKSNKTGIEFPQIYIQRFPYPSYTKPKNTYSIGAYVLLLGCVFILPQIIEGSKTTREKFAGTNILMSMNGIPNTLNLLSWIVTGLIFLSILCVISVGLIATPLVEYSACVLYSGNPIILFIFLVAHLAHGVAFAIHLSAHIFRGFRLAYTLIILNAMLLYVRLLFLEWLNHRIIPYLGVVFPFFLLIEALAEYDAYEKLGLDIQWSNFFDSANPLTKFEGTVGMIVILSVIGTCLHFLLAIYVNAIKPGKFGIKRHPLFFLMRENKQKGLGNIKSLSSDVGDGKYFEPTSTTVQTAWIQTRNLNKVYNASFFNKEKVYALRDVSIDFYKGQITSILGHNGAGKSTLLSILSGLTKPTDGLIFVDSKSLGDNASEILKDVGFYAQSDICFPTLTIKEQLEFFAMVKKGGKSMFTIKSSIASLIRKLKLFDVKDLLPNKLSEDQKRKLCLGIAFAGDPSTLILDEPTSRLDYENKRIIWDMLLDMKGRKTILISTHDMEEADILGDRIAIMHEGRFKSYGTSLYLKKIIAGQSNIGVTLSVERWCDPDRIRHQIHTEAQIIEKQDKKIIVDAPISPTLSKSIESLEKNKEEFGVTGIELSHIGLERVFLKVAEDSDHPSNQDEVIIHNEVKRRGIEIQLQSFKALLAKNVKHAMKDIATLVIAVISALLVLSMMYQIYLGVWDTRVKGVPKNAYMQLYLYNDPRTLYTSSDESIGDRYRLLSQSFGARSIEISHTNLDSAMLQSAKEDRIHYSNNLIAAAEFNTSVNGSITANAFYSGTISFSLPISVNLVSNVIIRSTLGDDFSITTLIGQLTDESVFHGIKKLMKNSSYVIGVVFAIPIYYAIATFAGRPSIESASGFKHLQKMTGVSGFTYWAAMILSDMVQYLFLVALVLVGLVFIEHTFDLGLYGITEIGIMMLLLTLLAVDVLPIIYIFSFIRTKTNFALKCFTLIPIGLVVVECATIVWGAYNDSNDDTYFMMRAASLAIPYVSFLRAQIQFHRTGMTNAICKSFPNDFFKLHCRHSEGLCCEEDCKDRSCLKLIPYFSEDHIDSLKVCVIYLCAMPIIYLAIFAVLESKIAQKIMAECPTQPVKKSSPDEQLQLEESIIHGKILTLKKKLSNRTNNDVEIAPSNELFLAYKLRKNYGKVRAVEEVSLRINSSECLGLFGSNRSGKSTIFRIVAGSEIPDDGVMFVGQKHFKMNKRDFLSQIGYCPQYDATLKCLNCYDHLRLFARLRGVPEGRVEEEVRAWISRLNLNAYASQSSGTLSSGNRQRLNLAMALIGSPKFVLLDEPTTHMDPGARRSFWRTVQSCKDAGKTFLLASHNMDECEVLCERMAIMLDGKFLCLGTPGEMKNRFGAGYDVQIRISSRHTKSQVDRIKKNMRLLLQCVLTNENMGYLMYHVIGVGTTWSKIYGVMNKIKSKYDCIDDFLVIVRLSNQSID